MVVVANDDSAIREAAFAAIRQLAEVQGDLTSADLKAGFQFQGTRVPLINPQRGIFKPQRMRYLLSIRTVFPKPGARVWYDDQRSVHGQIYQGEEQVEYAFMGTDPNAADNRWLREAMESRTPIIYFLGVAPGLYKAIIPTYIVGWDATKLKASLAFGVAEKSTVPEYPATSGERRYALREVKQRLHQASFREAVFAAYRSRCAISGLPEVRLLDAAHIVSDANEALGQPIVANGLPLSKLHHAAFDAHLLGVDSNFRIHVSRRLLMQDGGPMLELLKRVHGEKILLPDRKRDHPDPDRLQIRFDAFRGYE
ncbi:HNH endonuclease [Steroidobacter cummioxidans]|uniref:HNH endonuclease n=1 Tax=Steroidobacter cummioxidans TaxID=1803913 RepID=UPI000E30F756|nr:HNH endonuclease [Steroidobacter cummioxidans]